MCCSFFCRWKPHVVSKPTKRIMMDSWSLIGLLFKCTGICAGLSSQIECNETVNLENWQKTNERQKRELCYYLGIIYLLFCHGLTPLVRHVTADQYKVPLTVHLHPVMKLFSPDELGDMTTEFIRVLSFSQCTLFKLFKLLHVYSLKKKKKGKYYKIQIYFFPFQC